MSNEKLVYYLCPMCGKDNILCYRYVKKSRNGNRKKYEYLGCCCDYYPHQNPVVEDAMKRLPVEEQFVPKHCTTHAVYDARIKVLEKVEC